MMTDNDLSASAIHGKQNLVLLLLPHTDDMEVGKRCKAGSMLSTLACVTFTPYKQAGLLHLQIEIIYFADLFIQCHVHVFLVVK